MMDKLFKQRELLNKQSEVKEHTWDRKFGEPLPTLTDVMKKKVTKKHILRETYERIGGK